MSETLPALGACIGTTYVCNAVRRDVELRVWARELSRSCGWVRPRTRPRGP